ncbi:hypothetical protein CN443_15265, partial [Bacillus cereus]
MPTIPNFPEYLNHEHHAWHMPSAHPNLPTRQILPPNPGAGLEFLTFHRNFIAKFHQWYDSQSFADQNAVAPWTSIPPELKVASAGWTSQFEADEKRILTNNPPFASLDELGLFIERGLHNQFLHGAAAIVYNEPIIGTIPNSPLSTLFYKIHGLIDYWCSSWRSFELAPTGNASINGGISAVSRIPNSMEVWWIGANGSVQGAWPDEGGQWGRYELAPAGSASPNGGITAESRIPSGVEVWWIGANGSVQGAYWPDKGGQWGRYELAPAGSASPNGEITAKSRIPSGMEVWWIGANGSVQGAYWPDERGQWGRYELAPAGSASPNGGITAESRIPSSVEVWWI